MDLLIGSGTVVVCLMIQCFGVAYWLRFLHRMDIRGRLGSGMWKGAMLLISVMLILLTSHVAQIALWAELFVLRGEFDEFTTAFYHSAVNFTSLGYGDIVMTARSLLLAGGLRRRIWTRAEGGEWGLIFCSLLGLELIEPLNLCSLPRLR